MVVKVIPYNEFVADLIDTVEQIYNKTMEDKKPPTGNQNCQLCTWCVESFFRGYFILPRPIYSPADIVFTFNGYDIVKNPELIYGEDKNDLFSVILNAGSGSRFYTHVNWKDSKSGHEFILINLKNKIYVIDAQNNIFTNVNNPEVKDYFDINFKNSYIVRMDNKSFNKDMMKYNSYKYLKKFEEKDLELL